MTFLERIKKMKETLRSGAVVVCARGTGKTTALVEIYHEDKDAAVILANEEGYRRFINLYEEKYGKSPDRKYLMIGGFKYEGDRYSVAMASRKVYIDELYVSKFTGNFHGAVTSYPQPVVVISEESGAI